MDKNKNSVQKSTPTEPSSGAEKFYDENGKLRRDNDFFLIGLLVFFVGIVIDLVTKAMAEIYFGVLGHAPVEVIPGLLDQSQ